MGARIKVKLAQNKVPGMTKLAAKALKLPRHEHVGSIKIGCIFFKFVKLFYKNENYCINEALLHTYKLDAETKVTKRFRNPRARGCSVPSEARALLRAHGFLNRLVTVGRGV